MRFTLYPEYFDPSLSRKHGRRIRKVAPKAFSSEAIKDILASYKLKFEVREGNYPRTPWRKSSLYFVETDLRKSTIIKMIEKKLVR